MSIFDQAMAMLGKRSLAVGQIRRESVAGVVLDCLDGGLEFIADLRTVYPKVPPVHFGFTEDGSINAAALRYGSDYVIYVHGGAVALLSIFFFRVLADPAYVADIGNPAVEKKELPLFSRLVPDAEQMDFGRIEIPQDTRRLDFSRGLLLRAFRFLVAHETVHVVNGHVSYLNRAGFLMLSEKRLESTGNNLDRQAMEMDADHGATCEGMQALINACAPSPEMDPETSNHFHLNPRQAFFAWFFAVHTLFRFFGDQRFTPKDLLSSDYPPPRLRQIFLTAIATDFVLKRSRRPDLSDICRRTSFKAMAEVEKAFAELSGTERAVGGIKDGLDFTDDHAMEVARHWRESLRPKLAPLAYGELSE
jgi:hypothetical protein